MRESRYNVWVERGDAAYVFNGVSGALLRVQAADRQSLREFLADHAASCPPRLLAQLAEGRMLVPNDADEVALLSRRYRASRGDTSRFALTIITSLGCNFDCPYCFEAKHPSLMDDDVQDMVLRVLDDQLPKISGFKVSWFGGEPLVGRKALFRLSDAFIERCDRAGVAYGAEILTNGYLLDEETCARLRDVRVTGAQVGIDGPPDIHNRMRPLVGGQGTFWRILDNLRHAVNYMRVNLRVNVDTRNIGGVEELLQLLAAEGLSGKLVVYPGQIVGVDDGVCAPSASYNGCFTRRDFAAAEQAFNALAVRYGFSRPTLPMPTGAPCTAVRSNALLVGSKGELYKCWESVGNDAEVIGHIRDYANPNGRLQKWLKYDPFANDECRGCIALPVCMGGCARHAMDSSQYENRCGTFRHNHEQRVLAYVDAVEESGGRVITASLAAATDTR